MPGVYEKGGNIQLTITSYVFNFGLSRGNESQEGFPLSYGIHRKRHRSSGNRHHKCPKSAMSDDRISIVMNKFEQEIKDIMALEPSPLEARVEDYLNDKLQTAADLESLDSLLVDVKKQQGLLRQQVNTPASIYLVKLPMTLNLLATRSKRKPCREHESLRVSFVCSPTASPNI